MRHDIGWKTSDGNSENPLLNVWQTMTQPEHRQNHSFKDRYRWLCNLSLGSQLLQLHKEWQQRNNALNASRSEESSSLQQIRIRAFTETQSHMAKAQQWPQATKFTELLK
jgi:hypothetical protein